MSEHLSEMNLVALFDGELARDAESAARRHHDACLDCRRRGGALAREDRLLGAAIAPEMDGTGEVRREFAWVVAAGVLLSFGVLALRRLASGVFATDAPGLTDVSLLNRLGYALVSLFDFAPLLTLPFIGGLVAMTLIAIAAIALAARALRPGRAGALILAALIPALSTLPAPAEAFEIRRGDDECRIPAGEVVEDDVLFFCGSAVIAGEVRGDVFYMVQALTVSGVVGGDLIGLSERLDIEGEVGLSWRGLAQTARILGRVGHGVSAGGQFLELRPRSSIGGSAFLAAENVTVSGEIGRSLAAAGTRVDLEGAVGGQAHIVAGGLRVGPQASVGGTVRFHGDEEPVRAAGAPEVEWVRSEPEGESMGDRAWGVLLRWMRAMALGAVLLLFAAGPVTRVAARGRRPLAPLLLGLLLFVGLPFAAVLSALTFVGIPIGAALVALYLLLLYSARVVAGLAIGEAILGPAATRWRKLARIALGLGIFAVVLEIPVAGTVASLMVMFFGLGAFALWAWNTRRAGSAMARG